jgi:hypothetical protein
MMWLMPALSEIRSVLRRAWGPDTCDPHDLATWHRDNPARGQCGTTALVVHGRPRFPGPLMGLSVPGGLAAIRRLGHREIALALLALTLRTVRRPDG